MRSFSFALGVKEIEPGEFHWILLQEEETDDETLLSYSPTQLSAPYRDVLAAWAAGYLALARTLDMAHTGLMNSPGHRANILNPAFGRVGIGILDGGRHGLMVTQTFRN